jgi:multiple sugar transport system ATP-binding protein
MKDGRVRQCAPPTEIYARPADQFVASFVGTPTMNFLTGAIEALPDRPGFRVTDGRADGQTTVLPLPRGRFALEGVSGGTPAVLGVRPDALRPVGEAGGLRASEARVQATLESIDRYGDRMDLRLRMHDVQLVARTAPDLDVSEGARVTVAVDLARAHLFAEDELGRTLLSPHAPALRGQPT